VGLFTLIRLFVSSHATIIAENLFLRKQLALLQERKVKPQRSTAATRAVMVLLSRFFEWRKALVVVKPETFLKWHRTAFRAFWKWKSRARGRPRLPPDLRELIREMARDNPTWGQERIADELRLKLGIRVSPRTVGKYLGRIRPGGGSTDQRWATFIRNQATAIVACDFLVSITLTFRVLYVFVAMEIGSRRILHCNVTEHPTAEWTTQQFREVFADLHPYRFVIHDRDSIFSSSLDSALNDFGVRTENACPSPKSECLLRAPGRDNSPGVFGLPHANGPTAPSPHSERVRCPLQSWTSSCLPRTGDSGADPGGGSG
jgi:hypothetical protein